MNRKGQHHLTEPEHVRRRIKELLQRWSQGDSSALNELVPLVYADLRRIAGYLFNGERKNHTLGPTIIVHEAFMKLRQSSTSIECQDGHHFLAIYARAMRHILIDYSRKKNAGKRYGEEVPLDDVQMHELYLLCGERRADLLALDEAMTRLAQINPRLASVVNLRFFCGLDNSQVGKALKISANTVIRDWRFAESWLRHEIESAGKRKDTN